MRRWAILSVAVVGVILAPRLAHADVYMVKDSRGVVYFTNDPPTAASHKILKRYSFAKTTTTISAKRTSTVTAVYPTRYDRIIVDAARRHALDPALVKAVIKVESDFDRYALSRKGAKGLMQLMPATAREMNVNQPFDPAQNVDGGARYLRRMLDEFGGDLRLALAAYNAGPTAVKKHRGIPPFDETRRYVRKVWRAYGAYRGGTIPGGERGNVYYTYMDETGSPVFTDNPVGRKRILSD
jgi:soluble lytic murein transglycosylase